MIIVNDGVATMMYRSPIGLTLMPTLKFGVWYLTIGDKNPETIKKRKRKESVRILGKRKESIKGKCINKRY